MLARLEADLKTAMKGGDKRRVATLRLLLAGLKNEKIQAQRELTDEEVEAVLRRAVKQRKDSIEQFTAGGRQDLVDKEKVELQVLESYLPARLGAAEIAAEVAALVAETGASGAADMGKVMAAAKARFAGRAEMGMVSAAVKAALAR